MPIYEYECPGCEYEQETILRYSEADNQICANCGKPTRRVVSLPQPAQAPTTGKDKVLHTLNQEKGYDLPGGARHRPRYEAAMSKGLDQTRPVIGVGF